MGLRSRSTASIAASPRCRDARLGLGGPRTSHVPPYFFLNSSVEACSRACSTAGSTSVASAQSRLGMFRQRHPHIRRVERATFLHRTSDALKRRAVPNANPIGPKDATLASALASSAGRPETHHVTAVCQTRSDEVGQETSLRERSEATSPQERMWTGMRVLSSGVGEHEQRPSGSRAAPEKQPRRLSRIPMCFLE